jgi:thiamine biosynthesis lipoprotein
LTPFRTIARFEAIGSQWWIVTADPLAESDEITIQSGLLDLTNDFNQAYSRFLPESLISQLNRQGSIATPPLELLEMVVAAESMRQASKGAFNIGVGPALDRLGYDANYRFSEAAGPAPILPGSAIETCEATLIKLVPSRSVDLGGLGKGWLIDKLAAYLKSVGLKEFYVNGGGDIVAAGDIPKRFAIENPLDVTQAIGEIILTSGALAASAPNRRTWTSPNSGRTHHHLIDPATGESHPGPAAIHVAAPTATLADMASTALYIMPPEAQKVLARDLELTYLTVDNNGRAFATPSYPGRLYR